MAHALRPRTRQGEAQEGILSLARRLRAPVAVCYPVPLRGQWSDVPAVLDRSGVAFAKPLAWAPRAGEGWCE